jgi:CTP-dependent riboflavin kinase
MASYDFSAFYENNTRVFEVPIVLEGEVVHGFKRGYNYVYFLLYWTLICN